jgi:hypothetical protein
MPTPKYDPETYHPQQSYSAKQLSRYDMQVAGVVVYVVAMAVFFVVALVLMLFWNETATQAHAQSRVEAATDQQSKLAELTQPFPKPRIRAEDVNDDIAQLHAREDLLLANYTRVDGRPGTVRIPVERAMQLMAQRGLPTAAAVQPASLMTGDAKLAVAAPLTSGFAPTENEQAEAQAQR